MIVLTLGSTSHRLGSAALAASAALVVVALAGVILARQLSSVPENAMKMVVGLMLVSFGTFWSGESVVIHWPGSELAMPVLVGCSGLVAWLLVAAVAHPSAVAEPTGESAGG